MSRTRSSRPLPGGFKRTHASGDGGCSYCGYPMHRGERVYVSEDLMAWACGLGCVEELRAGRGTGR